MEWVTPESLAGQTAGWMPDARDAKRPAILKGIAGLNRPLGTGGVSERGYAENELPQPQPPVLLGFLNVNPEPCMDVT
jgi:hypothetical protein